MSEVKAKNRIVWLGAQDAMDIWQPIDNWYSALYKRLISQIQYDWLKNGNAQKKLTASDPRILITQWVGEAHQHLQSADYNKTLYRCFEKTRCLIPADGSNGTKINPEGLNYVVPKPLPFQVNEDVINCPVPEPALEPDDIMMNENLGLYEGAKRPKCNSDFTSEIGANDLILPPALYRES